MLDELLMITRFDEVASQVLQADDDVFVYVGGNEVVVAKEHEYEALDEHYYSLLARAEFLRFLEFLDEVARMPTEADAKSPTPIFVESVSITAEEAGRFRQ